MEHYENITIGPRYALRLEQLREWHLIRVTCGQCRHSGDIYPQSLRARFRDFTRVVDLERHFVCTRCGNRDGNSWRTLRILRD